MSAAMMKIRITIQIIIINIYINLLFTTDSLKKVILIGESYSRFFKPNTGAMQCLIKVAESQVHHKWAVSRSIQELSEWMLCYLPQQPRHSRIYASRIIFCTLALLSYWMCTSRNNGMMSSKKSLSPSRPVLMLSTWNHYYYLIHWRKSPRVIC